MWIVAIFCLLNILHAKYDSWRIGKGLSINHAINAIGYIISIVIMWFISKNLIVIPAILLSRLLFFNIGLSLFRGLKWDYISPSPLSFIDKITKKVFRNGKIMYGVYLILFIISLVIAYENNL